MNINDAIYIAKQLEKAGADMLHVSGGTTIKRRSSRNKTGFPCRTIGGGVAGMEAAFATKKREGGVCLMFLKEDNTYNNIREKSLLQWLDEMEQHEDIAVRGGVKLCREYMQHLKDKNEEL